MAYFLDQFETLPTEVLANILSFTSIDTDEISELLTGLLSTTTARIDQDNHDNNNSNSNSNNDEESIFRALCLVHRDSGAADASEEDDDGRRPPYFTSWKVWHRVLAQWVHRQGFYSILEAAPWGLLVRLRFNQGRVVGDLMWPTAEHQQGLGADND
jgi:hypothetical protein